MILSHRKLRAHKEYSCWDCGRRIRLLEYYYRIFGGPDDMDECPYEMKFCKECHEAPYIQCSHCDFDKEFERL